jgi:hypothetical protein
MDSTTSGSNGGFISIYTEKSFAFNELALSLPHVSKIELSCPAEVRASVLLRADFERQKIHFRLATSERHSIALAPRFDDILLVLALSESLVYMRLLLSSHY